MSEESISKKLKREMGIGPLLISSFILLEVLTILSNLWLRLPMNLNLIIQIILSTIFLVFFLVGFLSFLKIVRRYSVGLTLNTQGPYAFVRHPLYATFALTLPAFFLIWFNDLIYLFPWFIILIILHFAVKIEEKVLTKKFGAAYSKYKTQVPSIIPYKWKVNVNIDV